MAGFTTIAAATIAVGGSVAKGFIASDGASEAARMAGRLRTEQDRLEKESVARLEQNFLKGVRATTDVYDKMLQNSNAVTGQIIEKAAEGEQRGLGAAAGKVKQASDATTGEVADKFADQQFKRDVAEAEAGEKSASEIAAFMDDRAAAAGVKADALTQQADDLSGQATGSFLQGGVNALSAGISAFGGLGGGATAQGKAADALSKASGIDRAAALKQIQSGGYDSKTLKGIIDSGKLPGSGTFKEFLNKDLGAPLNPTTGKTISDFETPNTTPDFLSGLTPEQVKQFQEYVSKNSGKPEVPGDYSDFQKMIMSFGGSSDYSNFLERPKNK